MMEGMIEATNLTKRYRKKLAVDGVSFRVASGRVTGFLGPNGAGKSTTMRLMLGLDTGMGSTTYDGKPLPEYERPSQVVGILLEAKAYHPTRSARQHLRILADAGGIPASRVEEALAEVGLIDVASKKPGKFSLGMSQRLGIAAAILGKPKYLILDEPANGLDPEGIAWLREYLKSYADQGNAVFVSSHLLSEMALMADDVVVIGKGKLIATATMKDLVSGSSHNSVFVRTSESKQLTTALTKEHISYEKSDDGFLVQTKNTDVIGKIAYDARIPILELSPRSASLEEVFLELTENANEYSAKLVK